MRNTRLWGFELFAVITEFAQEAGHGQEGTIGVFCHVYMEMDSGFYK